MSYGALRFLYDSRVTSASQLTPSTTAYGLLSGTEKVGTGSATIQLGGQYTGTTTVLYTIEIDSITGGAEIGSATFRWRTSDTAAGTWEASGVTTPSTLTTLNNGVQIKFTAGTGDDFAKGDVWRFEARAIYGNANLIDLDRQTAWRSHTNSNICLNGTVESFDSSTLLPTFWSFSAAGVTITWESGTKHSGSYSLKVVCAGVDIGADQTNAENTKLDADYMGTGSTWKVTFWAKVSAGTLKGGFYQTGNDARETITNGDNRDIWTEYSQTFEANGNDGELQFFSAVNPSTFYIDDVTLEKIGDAIVIDLGSAQSVTACALLGHNFTGSATVKLQGNASDSWGSPSVDRTLTVTDPIISDYPTGSYRYWRVFWTDSTTTEDFFTLDELFLGTYLQLAHAVNAVWGLPRTYGLTIRDSMSEPGIRRRNVLAEKTVLSLSFPGFLDNTDFASLLTMQEALYDTSTGEMDNLFVHLFYDEADSIYFMTWLNIHTWQRVYSSYGLNTISLEFEEEPKPRV